MLLGSSGVGKTTLASWISENWKVPFISGSVSDLIKNTKNISHRDMLSRDQEVLYQEDFQILNLRNKIFKDQEAFVSDRSYSDSAAYFYYKQAYAIPKCEMEHFFELCKMMLNQQCTHLIFLEFTKDMINEWVIEDNNKRITNNYFQYLISNIMRMSLDFIGYKSTDNKWFPLYKGAEVGEIKTLYGRTQVLIVREPNLKKRKEIIESWLIRK
jgi:adenylate kinase family enzyme